MSILYSNVHSVFSIFLTIFGTVTPGPILSKINLPKISFPVLMLSCSQIQHSLVMIPENETGKFETVIIIPISRLNVCCILSLLLFGGVMLVCLGALLYRCHRYIAYRQLESTGVIWERTVMFHCLPVLSSGYEKSIHCKTTEDFTKCKSY